MSLYKFIAWLGKLLYVTKLPCKLRKFSLHRCKTFRGEQKSKKRFPFKYAEVLVLCMFLFGIVRFLGKFPRKPNNNFFKNCPQKWNRNSLRIQESRSQKGASKSETKIPPKAKEKVHRNERFPTIPYNEYKQIIISLKTLLKNSTEIPSKSKMYVLRKLYKLEENNSCKNREEISWNMKIVPWKLPLRNHTKNSTVNQQKLRTKRIISSISPERVASRVSARSQIHVTKQRRGKTFVKRGGIFSDENGRTVVPRIFSIHHARGSATCHARCLGEGASTRWIYLGNWPKFRMKAIATGTTGLSLCSYVSTRLIPR